MSRDLTKRMKAIESRLPRPKRSLDFAHLTDRQLELIELSIDAQTGHWRRDFIAALSQSDADTLLATIRNISVEGYRDLRENFGIARSPEAQTRVAALYAAAQVNGGSRASCGIQNEVMMPSNPEPTADTRKQTAYPLRRIGTDKRGPD